MEQSKTQKELLELGKSLVEELRLDTGDTLGRWMAHYVAELLKDAERAEGEERFTKSEICATMIMRLWDHRNQFPEENRPFKEFTNVFTSLENLSLDVEKTKYWAETRNLARGASVNKESKKWLAVADGVDDTAKILIRYCLTKAWMMLLIFRSFVLFSPKTSCLQPRPWMISKKSKLWIELPSWKVLLRLQLLFWVK